jgi:hypothetical protein
LHAQVIDCARYFFPGTKHALLEITNIAKGNAMSIARKLFLVLGMALLIAGPASASYTPYASEASFLAAVSDAKTDTFNGPRRFLSNAGISAESLGGIAYAATGHTNLNIILGDGSMCWGCNGSGTMNLTGTNVGSASGVFGFAFTLRQEVVDYNAYITFGDNSTLVLQDLEAGFYGFTSGSLIKHIEFAQVQGQASTSGYIVFNDVTVAAALVPEPDSLALAALGLLAVMAARRRQRRI